MLSQNITEIPLLPDKINSAQASVYEKIYYHLKHEANVEDFRNDPEAILDLIESFAPPVAQLADRQAQNKQVVELFKKEKPANVIHYAIEQDCGYSVIWLTQQFSKINPDVNVFASYDRSSISSRERQMVNYLINLSGLTQIKTFLTSSTSEEFLLSLGREYRLEWIIINHETNKKDIRHLKMMETLCLIHPGVTVFRLNDFTSEPDFGSYILSSPMMRRVYGCSYDEKEHCGLWNLVYTKIGDADKPAFYTCSDILDT